ncbi:hypothetical protein GCM10009839_44410 [Catenulispora yoronensis]|uniref:Uncharacterized protein n=1 Tax=Catenulispora yoronensis TaxID=450799 RepID=A0ABP5G188_9ACTN
MADQLQANSASLDEFGTRLEVAGNEFAVATNGHAAFPPEHPTDYPPINEGLWEFRDLSDRSLVVVDSYFTALAKMCRVSAVIARELDANLAKLVPNPAP